MRVNLVFFILVWTLGPVICEAKSKKPVEKSSVIAGCKLYLKKFVVFLIKNAPSPEHAIGYRLADWYRT